LELKEEKLKARLTNNGLSQLIHLHSIDNELYCLQRRAYCVGVGYAPPFSIRQPNPEAAVCGNAYALAFIFEDLLEIFLHH
jgi:hypothetical protein